MGILIFECKMKTIFFVTFVFVSLANAKPSPKAAPHFGFSSGRTTMGSRCVFPFQYNGRIFNTCIYANNGGVPWCATSSWLPSVSSYGNCNRNCPTPFSEMTKDPWNEDIVIYEEETIFTEENPFSDNRPGDIVIYEEEAILPDKQTDTNKRPGDVVIYEEVTILPDKTPISNKRPGDVVVYEEETIIPDKRPVWNKRPGDVVVYEEETIIPDKRPAWNKRPGDFVVYEEELIFPDY